MAKKKYTHSWKEFFVAAAKFSVVLMFTGIMGLGLGLGGVLEYLGWFEQRMMESHYALIIAILGFSWATFGIFYLIPAWINLVKTTFGGDC